MTVYKENTAGLLVPSKGMHLGADNLRPNTISEGSYTVDPVGPTLPDFGPNVIHAWNPDAGADANGEIYDAVGSAPLYAYAAGTPNTLIPNWDGEFLNDQCLFGTMADMPDFKAATALMISFWYLKRSTCDPYAGVVSWGDEYPVSGGSGGSFFARRENTNAFQFSLRTSYGNASSGGTITDDTWDMACIWIGASTWYMACGGTPDTVANFQWSPFAKPTDKDWLLKFAGYPDPSTDPTTNDAGAGFNGRIGDVRVHNTYFDGAGYLALYAAGRQSY